MSKCLKYSLINAALGILSAFLILLLLNEIREVIFIFVNLAGFFSVAYAFCYFRKSFSLLPFLTGLLTGIFSLLVSFIILQLSLICFRPESTCRLKEILLNAGFYTLLNLITLGWLPVALISLVAMNFFEENEEPENQISETKMMNK